MQIGGASFVQKLRYIPLRPNKRRHGFGPALAVGGVAAVQRAMGAVEHRPEGRL
jgi:hypothetical protein